MTEVSVETCFVNLRVLSFSLKYKQNDENDNNTSKSADNQDHDNNIKGRTIMIITVLKAMILRKTKIT